MRAHIVVVEMRHRRRQMTIGSVAEHRRQRMIATESAGNPVASMMRD